MFSTSRSSRENVPQVAADTDNDLHEQFGHIFKALKDQVSSVSAAGFARDDTESFLPIFCAGRSGSSSPGQGRDVHSSHQDILDLLRKKRLKMRMMLVEQRKQQQRSKELALHRAAGGLSPFWGVQPAASERTINTRNNDMDDKATSSNRNKRRVWESDGRRTRRKTFRPSATSSSNPGSPMPHKTARFSRK